MEIKKQSKFTYRVHNLEDMTIGNIHQSNHSEQNNNDFTNKPKQLGATKTRGETKQSGINIMVKKTKKKCKIMLDLGENEMES